MTKPTLKERIIKEINLFLLEIVLRIARHWQCDVEFPRKLYKNGQVKWMKLVFPKQGSSKKD